MFTASVDDGASITWYYRTSVTNSFTESYSSVTSSTVDCPQRTEYLPTITDVDIMSNEVFNPYDFAEDRKRIDITYEYLQNRNINWFMVISKG